MQPKIALNDWYYKQIRAYPVLPKHIENELLDKATSGDKKARDKLVEHNLRLVMSQANKIYYGMGLYRKSAKFDLIDLIAEGNLGLFEAIDHFDVGYGTSFTTIAVVWIQQKIRRWVQNNKGTVYVPTHLQEFLNKYKSLHQEFLEEIGRPPTDEEAAAALQVTESKIKLMGYGQFTETSLNMIVGENKTELQDLIACAEPALRFDKSKLDMVLDLLDDREAQVIWRRVNGETLEQVGRVFKLTRERIRQIEKKAIAHIKQRAIQVKRGLVTIGSEERRLNEFKDMLRESWGKV